VERIGRRGDTCCKVSHVPSSSNYWKSCLDIRLAVIVPAAMVFAVFVGLAGFNGALTDARGDEPAITRPDVLGEEDLAALAVGTVLKILNDSGCRLARRGTLGRGDCESGHGGEEEGGAELHVEGDGVVCGLEIVEC
jgi:hypothetical protein